MATRDLAAIASFQRAHIAVVGDVILDRTVTGDVHRVSPEAPIPVVKSRSQMDTLGGAANVAHNVCRLGGAATLIGVIGADEAAAAVATSIRAVPRLTPRLAKDASRPTTLKTRVVAQGQQLLRIDTETTGPVEDAITDIVLQALDDALRSADVVVLSDYAKGVLTPDVIQRSIRSARARGRTVVVDPKHRDLSRYAGATVLTPNAAEAAQATGIDCSTDEAAEVAARMIRQQTGGSAVVITRGARGMSILVRDDAVHLPAIVRQVHDVTGAGDTAVATLALAMAAGVDLPTAAQLANVSAGIAVGKRGTAVVDAGELVAAVQHGVPTPVEDKLVSRDLAVSLVSLWRSDGRRIVFTNGCFDLLHPGHIRLLQRAKSEGDVLVVAINTDASVARLKGPGRPINGMAARACVLSALSAVDLVVAFDEDTPLGLIDALKPDVLVKGSDYAPDKVVGREVVEAGGGRLVLVPIEKGYSTTAAIDRALRSGG
jgi:D-beta-D-heptose 7-phosphate kinase/D-beta-D-heptose 1-phosphate adenosyltransferase